MEYIATFFSHFGAVQFSRHLKQLDIPHKTMPVPRQLSSSCGSCVRFTASCDVRELQQEEVEKIYLLRDGSFEVVVDQFNQDES